MTLMLDETNPILVQTALDLFDKFRRADVEHVGSVLPDDLISRFPQQNHTSGPIGTRGAAVMRMHQPIGARFALTFVPWLQGGPFSGER